MNYCITLPLPPTTNQQYGQHGKIKYLTKLSKDWRFETQWKLKALGNGPVALPVAITLKFYLKFNRDVDNVKLLLDSLTGYWYEDDTLITELHIYKTKDKLNPRVEVSMNIL